MSKFTVGKWTYDPVNGIVHDDGKLIAEVAGAGGSNYRHARGEANARLIAVAPEMYDELYEALQLCDGKSSYDGDEFVSQAKSIRELLARIDGEDSDNE